MKTIVAFLVIAATFVGFSPQRNSFVNVETGDTIRLRFEPLHIIGDDKKLVAEVLLKYNKENLDGEKYYDAKVTWLPDNTGVKILTIYGEVSGGATVNPFAESYIIHNNMITDSAIGGEIFRVDVLKNDKTLLYIDNYWRLGSNISVYEATISDTGIIGYKTTKHGNYLFNCMMKRLHSSDSLPVHHHDENPGWLLSMLGVEESSLAPNTYYWTEDDHFLDRVSSNDEDYLEPTIYYRQTNGDVTEKIVFINNNGKKSERVLAMRASDPIDRISTEFVNDSIFRETNVSQETAENLQNFMAYEIDSIITDYRYDRNLNFTEIGKKPMHYRIERISENNTLVAEKRIDRSEPFVVNGLKVRWKKSATFTYYDKRKTKFPDINYTLTDESRNEILQAAQPSMPWYNAGYFLGSENFVDINLDGYADFKIYDPNASGSAGSFENVYLYSPKTKKFEFSEMFSGYDISIDTKSRTISSFGKSGGFNFAITETHLDKNSKILYVEEYRASENHEKLTLTYIKRKGKKILVEKTETHPLEKFVTREDVETALFSLSKKKN